jgi:hypothetical protein
VYSGRIVGYSIDSRMQSRLAVNALNNAVARRGEVAGCILHTDRGSQISFQAFRSRFEPAPYGGGGGLLCRQVRNGLPQLEMSRAIAGGSSGTSDGPAAFVLLMYVCRTVRASWAQL